MGWREIGSGRVARVATDITLPDRLGGWGVRWGINRMHYTVAAGLYAVGQPGSQSPVLVSANYKLTFDQLRRELAGRDVWLLLLETFGINVWCAAGKGTFGTLELINRINRTGLPTLVAHRTLIVPQLGAPGIAAHEVKKATGFKVHYGPIRAEDLPEFLDRGMEVTPAMRRARFNLRDRLVLIPVEVVQAWKPTLIICLLIVVVCAFAVRDFRFFSLLPVGLPPTVLYLVALLAGSVVTPILLPWIPGRAFSLKGAQVGLLSAILAALVMGSTWKVADLVALLFVVPAITAYFALNFTGCTTFTSLSGVEKEMRIALPVIILAFVVGVVVWTVGLLT
ncbi:MAG: dehydrogenase/acetyl-CoA synthase gamma subunit (corrinoid Fe-S protein)-like protein [Deltaproteobacteria bacterium]|nr:dehydrogenase/acetyl-CoA synthase gamma subunit (corrinoid Fe-S protein)-like protein [Deltaproteobacteria bacterium]